MPQEDRPRERLLREGPQRLSDVELLAIILRTGIKGRSVIELAQELLHHCESKAPEQRLSYLLDMQPSDLQRLVPGIGPVKLCQVMAALQLGRRAAQKPLPRQYELSNPGAVVEYLSSRVKPDREQFLVILLTTKNHVIDVEYVTEGTLNATLVHPREIFKPAIKRSAHAIILAHNHPSGDPTPSKEDHMVTRRMVEAGKTIGIEVLDHLVLGKGHYISFRERRLLEWS